MTVLPYVASEKLLAGFMGQPPFLGCGVSTYWDCAALATDNESAMTRGRPKGKAQRTADLKRGMRAFARVADSNNIPDRDDAARIMKAMFPDLPLPGSVNTRNEAQVREMLDDGFAISIALRLTALPASSPLREYTSADHQVTIHGRKGDRVRRIDPMHDYSLARYIGEMVPLDQVWKAAKAIGGGAILGWAYPIGGWTREKLAEPDLRRALKVSRDETDKALKDKRDLKDEVAALERQIIELEADGGDPDAARDALLDSLVDWVAEQRAA